jgi:hypothetical protein
MTRNRGLELVIVLAVVSIVALLLGIRGARVQRAICLTAIDDARLVAFGIEIGLAMEREAIEASPHDRPLDIGSVDYYAAQANEVLMNLLAAGDACGAPQFPDGCEASCIDGDCNIVCQDWFTARLARLEFWMHGWRWPE